jgi:hypothetical protein
MTGQSNIASQVQTCPAHAPVLRSWRVFPGEAGQLRALRQWLKELLPPCEALDDAVFVASELGANAVRHTSSGQGGQFAVEIIWAADSVRVGVVDEGGPSEPRIIEAPKGEDGRGLLAVRELSARIGCDGNELGRVVWADVPWAAKGGPPPQDSAWDQATAAGLEILQARFPQIPSWFGHATSRWWAMVAINGQARLISAASPSELAALLEGTGAGRGITPDGSPGRAAGDRPGFRRAPDRTCRTG